MEKEGVIGNRPGMSPGRHHAGMTDRERAQQLAIRTSFYALRNNILEEIRAGNHAMVNMNDKLYQL